MGKDKGRKDRDRDLVPPPRWAGEAELHALARSVGAAVLIADATGALLFASEPLEALAEALGAPLSGVGWLEVLSSDDRARARELWIDAAEAREPREARLTLAGGGGPRLWRVTPVLEDDRVVRWVVALAEESPQPLLRAQADRIERGDQELSRIAAELLATQARLSQAEARLAAEADARAAAAGLAERLRADLLAAEGRVHELAAAADRAGAFASELQARLAEAEAHRAEATGARALVERQSQDLAHEMAARVAAAEERARALTGDRAAVEAALQDRDRRLAEVEARLAQAERQAREAVAQGDRSQAEGERLRAEGLAAEAARSEAEVRAARAEAERDALAEALRLAGVEREDLAMRLAQATEVLAQAESAQPEARPVPALQLLLPREGASAAPPEAEVPSDLPAPAEPPGDADPTRSSVEADEPWLDQLDGRLRSPALRAGLSRWRAARRGRPVPALGAGWEEGGGDAPVRAVLAEVGADGEPRPVAADAASERTGSGSRAVPAPVPLASGWRRCARSGRPVHEFAELRLGPSGTSFERLLLPFSSGSGRVDAVLELTAVPEPSLAASSLGGARS